DWAAPSLVTHLVWGAALARLFAESYVVLRCGTLAWGLLALLACYALVRRARLAPREALFLTLSVGLSPWFVHLAFSYMSDVPWMALMLFAMLTLARADRGQPGWLVLSGLALGTAALSRQLAVVTVPAFVAVIALDARAAAAQARSDPPAYAAWRKKALAR